MTTQGERLATVEEWAEGHEKRCEERLKNIHTAIDGVKGEVTDMRGTLRWLRNSIWAAVFALLAWAGAQMYATNQARLAALEKPVVVTRAE